MNVNFYVNFYADQIEERMPDLEHDPHALDALRDEIQADPRLSEDEKQRLSDRIGQYVQNIVDRQP